MNPLDTFIKRCDLLAGRRRWKRSTLSTRLFNDGKRLDQLAKGQSDVGVRRLVEAESVLSELEREDDEHAAALASQASAAEASAA